MIAAETDRHLTTLDLDRLTLADLAPGDRQRIDAHAGRCARCTVRRSEHQAAVAEFRVAVLPRTLPLIEARGRPLHARLWGVAIALPALAAGILVLTHRFDGQPAGTQGLVAKPTTIAIKGDDLMQVFALQHREPSGGSDPTSVARVASGQRLAPGDALRFVLYPSGLPYALIASVDGAGQVSVYFPFHGEESAAVDGALAVPVAGSIVLDRAPGPERLFAIFSERPVAARVLRGLLSGIAAGGSSAIRSARQLPLPGTRQATLLFEKEVPR
ncbi:MAG TPA: hypothetical protein VFH68_15110 [Polyangia bacterium]|jgi:hypothetical protein|nr:hypothetical protein [Polyangia bacterium]